MSNPLVDLKGLSEPLTKLVEVVSQGIGTLYSPFGTVRQAKADAKSKIIHAKTDADVLSIEKRAHDRLIHREALRQQNIESITSQAGKEMPEHVSKDEVNKDWTIQFFDYAQDVHDEDLQQLWSRILAGEVSSPGRYSKRTLQFLKSLDKWEAELFSSICSFALQDKNGWHFLFIDEATSKAAKKIVGEVDWFAHLTSIGLFSPEGGHPAGSVLNGLEIKYHESKYVIRGPEKPDQIGKFPTLEPFCHLRNFSQIGQQLALISGATPVEGYLNQLSESLKLRKIDIDFDLTP